MRPLTGLLADISFEPKDNITYNPFSTQQKRILLIGNDAKTAVMFKMKTTSLRLHTASNLYFILLPGEKKNIQMIYKGNIMRYRERPKLKDRWTVVMTAVRSGVDAITMREDEENVKRLWDEEEKRIKRLHIQYMDERIVNELPVRKTLLIRFEDDFKKWKKDIEDDRPVEILPRVDSEKSRVPTMRRDHCRIIRSSSREKNEDKESNVARREVSKSARMQVDIEPDYCVRLVKKGKTIGIIDMARDLKVNPEDFDQVVMSKSLLYKYRKMTCDSFISRHYKQHFIHLFSEEHQLCEESLVEDRLTAHFQILLGKHVERWKEEDNERLRIALKRRKGEDEDDELRPSREFVYQMCNEMEEVMKGIGLERRNYRGSEGEEKMEKQRENIGDKKTYCGVCQGVFTSINDYFIHCMPWSHFEKIRHGPLIHLSLLISVHEGKLYDDKSLVE